MTGITRRTCLDMFFAGCALQTMSCLAPSEVVAATGAGRIAERIASMPRLFCLAYISPTHPDQAGQERTIAKFPIAIVPQANGSSEIAWRNAIRSLNPQIVLLAYLDLSRQSPAAMGPGFARLMQVKSAFIQSSTDPSGFVSYQGARLFDRRSREWMDAFVEAASVTLESYPYQGIFFDNCTIWSSTIHPSASALDEMQQATQEVFLRIRKLFPDALLVGNGIESWKALNGKMNENRPKAWKKELSPYLGQTSPPMNMAVVFPKTADQTEVLRRQMEEAHSYGAFFCATVTPQHVVWFDMFDDVIAASRR